MNDATHSDICIETLDPMRVACYRAISPSPEEDGSQYLDAWVARQRIEGQVRRFGFDTDVPPAQQKPGVRGYEVWRTVPADVQPSSGVTMKDFPGGLYAVMTLHRPFTDPSKFIPAGWKELHEWVIHSSRYRSASHQWLEELIAQEDGAHLRLYHPVMLTG